MPRSQSWTAKEVSARRKALYLGSQVSCSMRVPTIVRELVYGGSRGQLPLTVGPPHQGRLQFRLLQKRKRELPTHLKVRGKQAMGHARAANPDDAALSPEHGHRWKGCFYWANGVNTT